MGNTQSAALDQKIMELEQQLASIKLEASSTEASLEASKREVEKLREQISAREKVHRDIEMKLGKVMELEKQLSSTKDEASSTRASFQASEKEVLDLKEQLLACKKVQQDTEMKLQQSCDQLSSMESELRSNKVQLDVSRNELEELKAQVSTCIAEIQKMEAELQRVRDQVSLTTLELQSTTMMLHLSKESAIELEDQLSTCDKESESLKATYQNVEDRLSAVRSELHTAKIELGSSSENMKELEHELSSFAKKNEAMVTELGRLQDERYSIMLELDSTLSLLESSNRKVVQLEELQRLKNELLFANNELLVTINALESYTMEAENLKDQYSVCKTEVEQKEARLQRLLNYARAINSEVKLTNNESDAVEISTLFTEQDIDFGHPSPTQLHSEGNLEHMMGVQTNQDAA